ncbi:hypothetical protein CkaCkLH20_04605 [Colletotrichum karsti]|uniref:Transmembrane protein n=1 Tax=Colletotrichum karsti TaxID=1095194 RepID=A0A9P6I863_9PEZI|nr:uncharacterized protein CkaCkLH20_04605 [Colletotrichum karsti]KAF9878029.1 hypothetical protein CkaCkLH20_04605 [Colletotrichum karsti]
MPSRRRSSSTSSASSYSPSRSSSAGPHPRNVPRNYIRNHAPRPKKPSFKTTAVFIAAIAVATICVHRVWTKRRSDKDNHHRSWENTPGRRSVRRNVVRDRHNGYIIDEHEEWTRRRRLPEREYRDRDRRSRFYDDESDGYYSDHYHPPPPPSNRTQQRLPRSLPRSRADGRSGRSLVEENFVPVFEGPRDEVVRYEKAPTVRSATGAAAAAAAGDSTQQVIEEDTTSRRRVEDAVEDWHRRGSRRFPSPERRETVFDDRRSRRASAYN